jgi:hypothetical protein
MPNKLKEGNLTAGGHTTDAAERPKSANNKPKQWVHDNCASQVHVDPHTTPCTKAPQHQQFTNQLLLYFFEIW